MQLTNYEPKHMKQKLMALKGEICYKLIVGDFNTPLSIPEQDRRSTNIFLTTMEYN